jgi:hypothetical protein|tara:strand:+ start:327 stop:530 length:204 start_codon:yes stop_codon:yes gene_type:complete
MTRSALLKKFDKETETLWDQLYKIKDLLESAEDYELSELGGKFLDQIAEGIEDGDISLEDIRDQISG